MRLPTIHSAQTALLQVLQRFPVAVVCSALFAFQTIWIAHYRINFSQQYSAELFFLFSACFTSIAFKLVAERGHYKSAKTTALMGSGLLALALLVFTRETWHEWMCIAGASVLCMFVAPYLHRSAENEAMWTFCYRLSIRILFTFLAAVILYVGLLLVINSVNYLLLGERREGQLFFYLWIVVATFFSPLLAMAGIPKSFEEVEDVYPTFLRVLLVYIVLPLWCAYNLVLYVYMGKVLFTGTLPKGEVAYFVSLFGIITVAIYLKGYPLFKQGAKGLVRWFYSYGLQSLVLPLLLLAVAVAVRVRAYGVTEERYLLLVGLLWLALCVAIRRYDSLRAPRRMLCAALVLLVLSSVGPWGMSAVSSLSQWSRLMVLLQQHQMLNNGKLVPTSQQLTVKDEGALSDALDYFVDSGKEHQLLPLFQDPQLFECKDKENCETGSYTRRTTIKNQLSKAMGITYINRWDRGRNNSGSHYFTLSSAKEPFDIRGFDYVVPVNCSYASCSFNENAVGGGLEGKWKGLSLACAANKFTFSSGAVLPVTLTMEEGWKKELLSRREKSGALTMDKPIVMDGENAAFSVRLIINVIRGSWGDDQKVETSSVEGLLLLKPRQP